MASAQSHVSEPEPIAFSNAVRLSLWQWLGVLVFAAALAILAPILWKQVEPFALEPDYRMPHDLSNDYWLYARFAAAAAAHEGVFLLGDSVIWGEYVKRHETLSTYVGEQEKSVRFANLGLDGAHPLALSGLVEHYARPIAGKKVLLHCNPLWLSRPKADLQVEDAEVNHPRLIPQFAPRVPPYKEEISGRIGVLVEQRFPLNQWTSHLQQAYYGSDIPTWTIEHPCENPLEPLNRDLPATDHKLRHLPQPWYKSGITKQDFPWVDLETSLQWRAFQRTLHILQERGNKVFVLVGPFNEHLLTPPSLKRYEQVKTEIAKWLEDNRVPHAMPPALPSELYGDASHPLAEGYAALARQLQADDQFRTLLAR